MTRHDAVVLLLHKAGQDEAVLRALLGNEKIDTEILGFHAQQAVEKLLKAWLCHAGIDYPRVHNLNLLAELLASHGLTIPPELADFDALTPFATVFRYDALPLESDVSRQVLLDQVCSLRSYIESRIN